MRVGRFCGAGCALAWAIARPGASNVTIPRAIKGQKVCALDFISMIFSPAENYRNSRLGIAGKRARRNSSRGPNKLKSLETRSALKNRRLAEPRHYAEGGARGEVCENTGAATEILSSGSGSEAIGFSESTDGATTNCAGAWWPKWQYGQLASSLGLW